MKTILAFCLWISSVSAFAGGTTAGGGNVQPPDQVAQNELVRAVQLARPIVTAWYSERYAFYQGLKRTKLCADPKNQADCQMDAKLFDGSRTIFDVIESTPIETRLNGPCMDFNNKPNDGSIFGARPGSICISISNIRTKLRQDNYENQIAALIAHELSHLVGTTEPEAQNLQWYMLNMDLAERPFTAVELQAEINDSKLSDLVENIHIWQSAAADLSSYDGFCQETNESVNRIVNTFAHNLDDYHFRYLTPKLSGLFWGTYVKLHATWNYVCGQDQKESQDSRQMAAFVYQYAFQNKNQIPAPEYGGGFSEYASPDVILNRIQSIDGFKAEASQIKKLMDSIFNEYKLRFETQFSTY